MIDDSNIWKERLLFILAYVVVAVICLAMSIRIASFGTVNSNENANGDDNEVVREETDTHLYTVDELSESLVGKRIGVVGFMCNEVADKASAAWIVDDPFKSKEDVNGEFRIDTGEVIDYTPGAVIVIGDIDKDNNVDGDALNIMMKNARIYLYGGEERKYKRMNDILDANIIAVITEAVDCIEHERLDGDTIELINEAAEKCITLGENELEQLLRDLAKYNGENKEEIIEDAQIRLVRAVYEEGVVE